MKTEKPERIKQKHEEPRDGWRKWRSISDKIVKHPKYAHISSGRNTYHEWRLMLNLSRFAQVEMSHFNTAYWAGQNPKLP